MQRADRAKRKQRELRLFERAKRARDECNILVLQDRTSVAIATVVVRAMHSQDVIYVFRVHFAQVWRGCGPGSPQGGSFFDTY